MARAVKEQVDFPGAFEQLVLLAVARLGEGAYGMTVRRELEERTGRPISIGAVYATLERLERKGYVRSESAVGHAERAGRARRLVRLEPEGTRALREALATLDRLRRDVAGLEPAEVRR
jgi:DNA-binding PadR family transcriptional regulator